jgi:L-lactate dehydrogenase (cytochrome)
MRALAQCHNSADFEDAAMRRLPGPLFHYIAGGADDECTIRANTSAFSRYDFVPRYLRDVRTVSMRRTVLGQELKWPLVLAPTGMNRMFHPDGECAVARAAARQGIGYALSTMASTSVEEVSAACSGLKIYQLYLLNDDSMNMAIIDRAAAAGFGALCLTVDTIRAGNRERDLRSGLSVPPRLTLKSMLNFLVHPVWCGRYLTAGKITLPNVACGGDGDISTLSAYFAAHMEHHISWDRVEKLIKHWGRPFAIKGLQSVEDIKIAADVGCTAVIVSNHGGRQLDGSSATLDLIPNIADSFGDRLEIIQDGGIRRGSHIVKALAMGAHACMAGRPYLYGLAAYGQPGVERVLNLLHDETERTLALLGCSTIDELGREHLRFADEIPNFFRTARAAEPAVQLKVRRL